jgi:hypothetical protein
MRINAGFFLSAGLTTDAFSYDGKTMGNYALGWFSDSWNGDGSTGWLSGWGGIKLFTLSQPRMSITAGGNVGIGTTAPDMELSVNGNANKLGGGSWATFSDARLKDVHGTFNRGLKELMQLQPVVYSYNGRNGVNTEEGKHHTGFLAQEVQRVLPEAVTTSASGYLVLNQDPILWTMLNAIKEQQAQIGALRQQLEASRVDVTTNKGVEKQVNDLRSENADLRARLERLEALLGTEAKR